MAALFDPKAPANLRRLQLWFGDIIRQKMADDHAISPLAPNGESIEVEADRYIVKTDTLAAWQRLELYSQSYWLRLLEVLHEDFPMLVRLFSKDDFDRTFGIPYLESYPSSDWRLIILATHFTTWVEKEYNASDKPLVMACAQVDWACQETFFAKQLPAIDLGQYQGENGYLLLQKKLTIQPTVRLLELPGHFLHFRALLLAESEEHWHEADFPKLEKGRSFYFVIYRNNNMTTEWQEVTKEAYLLLGEIASGLTIEEACEKVTLDGLEEEVPFWLQEWLIRNWLSEQ